MVVGKRGANSAKRSRQLQLLNAVPPYRPAALPILDERLRDAGKLTDEEFLEFRGPHGWEAFERRVFVKETLLGALERDLRRYFRSAGPAHAAAPIGIGTATDPYQ